MITQKDRIEAAIRHIQTSADIDPWAMELAISALKAQMDGDTISRQAAIDALAENKEMINAVLDSLTLDYNTRRNQEQRRGQINEDIETIKELSSAQPEVIRCKDCVHSDAFSEGADNDMPLKCLGIRYGGVMPDWYCEHAERKTYSNGRD